jgi:hypothetical protein
MRPVLAPKVGLVEEDMAVAEKDKVAVEEDTTLAEEDKVVVEEVMAVAEEDKVVVEEEGGTADKDQRVVVASNYRYSTYNQLISNELILQICLIVSLQNLTSKKYIYCKPITGPHRVVTLPCMGWRIFILKLQIAQ